MSAAKPLIDMKEQHQLLLEQLYDKNQLMPRIRQAFRDYAGIKFADYMERAEIPEDFGFDLMAQMVVHKRATVPTMIGCLHHHLKSNQATADMIERAIKVGFVKHELTLVEEEGLARTVHTLIVAYGINDELQAELDRFQYPLPMVVPPRTLETNLDTGYLTSRASVLLGGTYHDLDVCLDHLNRMNRMALSINLDVARTIQNKWRGLNKKKQDETWEKFQQRRKAFEKYDSVAKTVIGLLTKEENIIYLTHRYDFRGRTYCMGFHITYQGTDWNKSCIEFADKEFLTD